MAKMVLNDFMRGKIPWFTPAPKDEDDEDALEGRNGKLGEMPRKRPADTSGDSGVLSLTDDEGSTGEEPFEGFGSDVDAAGVDGATSSEDAAETLGSDKDAVTESTDTGRQHGGSRPTKRPRRRAAT